MKKYSLSAIGHDQPGIVAALTAPLFKKGCNIEDSSMTILEGEFAVILIMSVPEGANLSTLSNEIDGVGRDFSLTVNMKEIASEPVTKKNPLSNYIITFYGEDNTGIVYKTSNLLAEMGINITDLETKSAQREAEGDEGGDSKKLYMMMMEVYAPSEADLKKLKTKLKGLSEELGLSMSLKPIEDYGRL